MKTPRLLIGLLVLALLPSLYSAGPQGDVSLLSSAKTVVFLGDSITYGGTYVADFTAWAETRFPKSGRQWINVGLASETVSGLSEEGHAGGKFPRPDLHERLARVLPLTKPDLVFACYGMNCGIYLPLDESRFAKYREGIEWLKAEVEKTGAKIIFITPPYYDKVRKPGTAHYTDVLAAYAKWLLERRKDGWQVIDLNGPMTAAIEEKRKVDPAFSVQPDAIHPDAAGHWLMAQSMIRWFGDEQAANAPSVTAMLEARGQNPEIYRLCQQRMTVLRDAWLTATKHQRPGVSGGKPLPEATAIAKDLTGKIDGLMR